MTKQAICFLVRSPLTRRDYDRFGLELIRSRGYEAFVLDLTPLLNPEYKLSRDLVNDKSTVVVGRRSDLAEFLKAKGRSLFVVDLVGAEYGTLFIYRYFQKFGVTYAGFALNALPVFEPARSPARIIGKLFTRRIFKTAANIFMTASFNYLCRALLAGGWIKAPDYVLVGGRKSIYKLPWPGAATKRIFGHALDYDIILRGDLSPDESGYAVFLDQYAPFHPDAIIAKTARIEAGEYYAGLNRFFDWFEAQTGQKVVIAAHPRSDYENKPECFGSRRLVKGRTAEMIAGASCVLLHESTAINFAVSLKKPMVFLTCDQFERTYHGPGIAASAGRFGRTPINVDRPLDGLTLDLACDQAKYAQYADDFIKTPGSPEKLFWEIVVDELNGTNKQKEKKYEPVQR